MGKGTSRRPAGDVGHSTRLSAEPDTGVKLLNRGVGSGAANDSQRPPAGCRRPYQIGGTLPALGRVVTKDWVVMVRRRASIIFGLLALSSKTLPSAVARSSVLRDGANRTPSPENKASNLLGRMAFPLIPTPSIGDGSMLSKTHCQKSTMPSQVCWPMACRPKFPALTKETFRAGKAGRNWEKHSQPEAFPSFFLTVNPTESWLATDVFTPFKSGFSMLARGGSIP